MGDEAGSGDCSGPGRPGRPRFYFDINGKPLRCFKHGEHDSNGIKELF